MKKLMGKAAVLAPVLALAANAMAAEGSAAASEGLGLWWLAPISSVVALLFAIYFYKKMMSAPEGTDKMIEIAAHVREGAYAYLFRQYKVVTVVFAVLFVVFAVLSYYGVQNPFVPVAFLTGGFFSGLCGLLGMTTATLASNRTAASKARNRRVEILFIPASLVPRRR